MDKDMKEKILYSVKDVCDRFGITRKTLFYYDRIGLLKPADRQGIQHFKFYDFEALSRLESILEYRGAGLSIYDIKKVIDLDDKEVILGILMDVRKRLISEARQKEEEIRKLEELIRMNSGSSRNKII